MNKLLTLTNMELKRNSKFYFIFICLFSSILLALNIIQINRFQDKFEIIEKIKENFDGVFYGVSIIYNNSYLANIMQFGINIIFIYSIYTWIREYSQKSIYTLKMIPCNKFNIYLSKIISTIVMIYGLLISKIIILFISKNIFNLMLSNVGIIKTSLFEDLSYLLSTHYEIPITFINFFMIYGLGLVVKLSLLFTLIVFIISFKNRSTIILIILSLLYYQIIIKFEIYRNIGEYYTNLGARYIGNIGVDFIMGILLISLLSYISYNLINKKLYI